MNETLELLGKQHQHVLTRLQEVENGLGGTDGLADFAAYLEADLAHHFAVEERALFPVLERHLGLAHGPLAVMNAEHTTFRELVHRLRAGVRSGDYDQQRHCTFAVIELLRGHIAKEDSVLFPLAARLLSPEEKQEVDARAAEVGTHATTPPA